jgi:hypothetical protein
MEETHEQHKLHGFLQCGIYASIALEASIFIYKKAPFWGFFHEPLDKLSHLIIYQQIIYSKLATFLLICLVSVGTLAKKKVDLDPKKHIVYPLTLGLLLMFCIWFAHFSARCSPAWPWTTFPRSSARV